MFETQLEPRVEEIGSAADQTAEENVQEQEEPSTQTLELCEERPLEPFAALNMSISELFEPRSAPDGITVRKPFGPLPLEDDTFSLTAATDDNNDIAHENTYDIIISRVFWKFPN